MVKNNEKIDAVKERILFFADFQGIKRGELYKKIGLVQSNFSGTAASSSLKTDKIIKILKVFPELNPEWLLLGNCEMIRNFSASNTNGQQVIANHNTGTINADNHSPDVLNAQIEMLNRWITEKDEQIREKDMLIAKLLDMIKKD